MAKLSPGRMTALCGRCGVTIAYVLVARDEYRDGSGWSDPYRVLQFGPGWRPDEHGVWVIPSKAQRRLGHGLSPYQHPRYWRDHAVGLFGGKQPTRLPVTASCASCGCHQRLDPGTLDVHPGDAIDAAVSGPYVEVPDPRLMAATD